MTTTFDDYDAAIRAFWAGREPQTQKLTGSGRIDARPGESITGGLHLNALQDLIAGQFAALVELGAEVRRRGIIPLPGYYRRAKNWDMVVTYQDALVAAIDCRAQVGSFGSDFDRRTEAAIANSDDFWHAYADGLLGTVRPWLGFVFVFEHAAESTQVVHDHGAPLYRTDPVFDGSSYANRYETLFQRLVRGRLYDAACLTGTRSGEGNYDEPLEQASTRNLTAAIAGRVAYIKALG